MYTAIKKYEISKTITLIKTIMTRSKLYKAKKGGGRVFSKMMNTQKEHQYLAG